MNRFDVYEACEWLVFVVCVVGFVLLVTLVYKEKKIDSYYVSTSTQTSTCVWAHWTWHPDERVFCTNDPQEALEFMEKANNLLKK